MNAALQGMSALNMWGSQAQAIVGGSADLIRNPQSTWRAAQPCPRAQGQKGAIPTPERPPAASKVPERRCCGTQHSGRWIAAAHGASAGLNPQVYSVRTCILLCPQPIGVFERVIQREIQRNIRLATERNTQANNPANYARPTASTLSPGFTPYTHGYLSCFTREYGRLFMCCEGEEQYGYIDTRS